VNLNDPNSLVPNDQAAQDPTASYTPPLGDDFGGEGDPIVISAPERKVNSGLMLLITVVLVAVAALFSMRKLAAVAAGAAIDREIEETVEAWLEANSVPASGGGSVTPVTQSVMMVLNETYSDQQVPLQDVTIIGSETVRVGETVTPETGTFTFRVAAIEKKSVRLVAEDAELGLTVLDGTEMTGTIHLNQSGR